MISKCYFNLVDYFSDHYIFHVGSIYNRHFLPFGRTDLATAASLQPIRGSLLQLHGPLLRSCGNLGS